MSTPPLFQRKSTSSFHRITTAPSLPSHHALQAFSSNASLPAGLDQSPVSDLRPRTPPSPAPSSSALASLSAPLLRPRPPADHPSDPLPALSELRQLPPLPTELGPDLTPRLGDPHPTLRRVYIGTPEQIITPAADSRARTREHSGFALRSRSRSPSHSRIASAERAPGRTWLTASRTRKASVTTNGSSRAGWSEREAAFFEIGKDIKTAAALAARRDEDPEDGQTRSGSGPGGTEASASEAGYQSLRGALPGPMLPSISSGGSRRQASWASQHSLASSRAPTTFSAAGEMLSPSRPRLGEGGSLASLTAEPKTRRIPLLGSARAPTVRKTVQFDETPIRDQLSSDAGPPSSDFSSERPLLGDATGGPLVPQARDLTPDDVVRCDRMIVKCQETERPVPNEYTEKASRKVRPDEKPWFEYAVVLRKGLVELWRPHRMPHNRWIRGGEYSCAHRIPLTKGHTRLTLFSSADAVFSLTVTSVRRSATAAILARSETLSHAVGRARAQPFPAFRGRRAKKKDPMAQSAGETKIYLFRARSVRIGAEWAWEIARELGADVPPSLMVRVDGIDARVRATLWSGEKQSRSFEERRFYRPEEVEDAAVKELLQMRNYSELHKHLDQRGIQVKLAWRRGDVIDWVWDRGSGEVGLKHGQSLPWAVVGFGLQSRDYPPRLELRAALHYPTTVNDPSTGKQLREPPAVEGPVTRIRPGQANEKLYLCTQNGALFMVKAWAARPPRPPVFAEDELPNAQSSRLASNPPSHSATRSQQQKRSASAALIRMLKVRSAKDAHSLAGVAGAGAVHDPQTVLKRFLRDDVIRQTRMVHDADGFLHLAEIESFATLEADSTKSSRAWNPVETVYAPSSNGTVATHQPQQGSKRRPGFALTLKNQRVIRFETVNSAAAQEWLMRLPQLKEYWAYRTTEDARTRSEAQAELALGGSTAKREAADLLKSRLLSRLYHWCLIDGCRAIVKAGPLYKKTETWARWKNRTVVLSGGHLVEYLHFERTASGKPLASAFHRRRHALHLRDCYVFSGELCEVYLQPHARDDHLDGPEPKFYGDGLRASEDKSDCVFAVWKKVGAGLGNQHVDRIYRARSKAERDEWIFAINVEIQRLLSRDKGREASLNDFVGIPGVDGWRRRLS